MQEFSTTLRMCRDELAWQVWLCGRVIAQDVCYSLFFGGEINGIIILWSLGLKDD